MDRSFSISILAYFTAWRASASRRRLKRLRSDPKSCLHPWYRLTREAGVGRLWMVGLSRLLAYRELLEGAELVAAKTEELELQLNQTPNDSVTDLAGLTLYVDTARRVTLRLSGHRSPYRRQRPGRNRALFGNCDARTLAGYLVVTTGREQAIAKPWR